ncbi:ribbon-helix-helix protein, CopG family [Trichothermofontia sp.]
MKKSVFFRLSDKELALLEAYCLAVGRTKSDVLRELIRKLKLPKKPSEKDGA